MPTNPDPPEARLNRLEASLAALGDLTELRAKVDRLDARPSSSPPAIREQPWDVGDEARAAPPLPPEVQAEREGRLGSRVTLEDEAGCG